MQKVVRTYPKSSDSTQTIGELNSYLSKGWTVVMCNTFAIAGANALLGQVIYGNEYIIEKDDDAHIAESGEDQ